MSKPRIHDGRERRQHPRTRIVTDVRLNIESDVIRGTLLDISVGGLSVEAEIRIAAGDDDSSAYKLGTPVTIDIPKLSLNRIHGSVVRVSSAGMGYAIAVQFNELRTDVAHRIIDRFARMGRR